VVRNLAIREAEKGLSTGEKQMYTRAKKILASELMYALEMDEEEIEAHLYGLLNDSNGHGHAKANGNGRVNGNGRADGAAAANGNGKVTVAAK
jgi:hypothetical protein